MAEQAALKRMLFSDLSHRGLVFVLPLMLLPDWYLNGANPQWQLNFRGLSNLVKLSVSRIHFIAVIFPTPITEVILSKLFYNSKVSTMIDFICISVDNIDLSNC